MIDIDTFLTTLYVIVDDFWMSIWMTGMDTNAVRATRRDRTVCSSRGPEACLCASEVITLSLFAQLARFQSERDFWRFATTRLRHLFPRLPDRTRFNRLERQYEEAILAFFRYLTDLLDAQNCAFEIVDRVGVATRWCGRRGVGWLPEYTDKGRCSRLGFFEGFHLLTVVSPDGAITGFGVAPASSKDQPQMDAFLVARHTQDVRCPFVGSPCRSRDYLADAGFIGEKWAERWLELFGVRVSCPPRPRDRRNQWWSKALHRWHAGLRQMIESMHNALLNTFRLARERPHEIRGFFARLAAKVAMHNFCIYLNRQLGRAPLEFADLIGW